MNELAPAPPGGALARVRPRSAYNAAERQFSCLLQQRLQELLAGKRNSLALLRRYPRQPERLGVMVTPPGLPRQQLRLSVVDALSWEAIAFVGPDGNAGPIAQDVGPDGNVVERQLFATRFAHIVLARTDSYAGEDPEPVEITWCLQRVQNQRAQTRVNRVLDAVNLALEVIKLIR